MTLPFNINLLDIVMLVIMFLFLIRGAFRGLVDEIAGLVSIVLGIWLSSKFYLELTPHVSQYIGNITWAATVSYVAIMVAVMIVVALIAKILNKFFVLTFTDWLNHLAGAAVGFAKGLLICAVFIALINYLLPDAPFLKQAALRPHIERISALVVHILPIDLIKKL